MSLLRSCESQWTVVETVDIGGTPLKPVPDVVRYLDASPFERYLLHQGSPPEKNAVSIWALPKKRLHPPPALNRALWGTLFSDQFEQLCQITVLMVISAPKHPGKP